MSVVSLTGVGSQRRTLICQVARAAMGGWPVGARALMHRDWTVDSRPGVGQKDMASIGNWAYWNEHLHPHGLRDTFDLRPVKPTLEPCFYKGY
jgi:hypothetical protein